MADRAPIVEEIADEIEEVVRRVWRGWLVTVVTAAFFVGFLLGGVLGMAVARG